MVWEKVGIVLGNPSKIQQQGKRDQHGTHMVLRGKSRLHWMSVTQISTGLSSLLSAVCWEKWRQIRKPKDTGKMGLFSFFTGLTIFITTFKSLAFLQLQQRLVSNPSHMRTTYVLYVQQISLRLGERSDSVQFEDALQNNQPGQDLLIDSLLNMNNNIGIFPDMPVPLGVRSIFKIELMIILIYFIHKRFLH